MVKIPEPANDDIDEAAELAEGALLLQDFTFGMDGIIRSMMRAQDQVMVEGAGLTARPFGDDVPIKIADAIYLPVLGGEVLRNGQRIASPTYKASSLKRAILQGHLEGRMDNNKMCVTIKALTEWIARGAPTAAPKTVRSAQTLAAVTARENERKIGSKESTLSFLDGLISNQKKK